MMALLTTSSTAFSPSATKPHLVFFMADDLGWNNVGWHNPEMLTPHADALVKEGIELDRHYAYLYCSPSRSSLMTGRLPYHVQQVNRQNCNLGQGAHRNFTFISAKLKQAGYATHHVGKWHLGMATWGQIPQGRGFDSSLVYFEGAEDHMTQLSCNDPMCLEPINASSHGICPSAKADGGCPYDFWRDGAPAKAAAGTRFGGYQFNDQAVGAVMAHDTARPFFMYLAPQSSHSPLQAPQEFVDRYPADWRAARPSPPARRRHPLPRPRRPVPPPPPICGSPPRSCRYVDRRVYAAMCSVWDEVLGNVTGALKRKGMWPTTLLAFSGDNGGPVYWSIQPSFQGGAGANNWPHKGGKARAAPPRAAPPRTAL